jgi:GABA permease
VGVALGIGLGALLASYLRSDGPPSEPPVWERRRESLGSRRLLVVANETCRARALLDEVRYRTAGHEADVLVVAPALTSHLRHWTSDTDDGRAAAQERLDGSLAALAAAGIRASGEIGDEDPIQVIEDALHTFGPDEVIVSTHPPGRSNWLEQGIVERARDRFPGVPITHVVVDLEREPA